MSLVCFTSSMPCFNPVSRQRHESLQHNFLDKCQCSSGSIGLPNPLPPSAGPDWDPAQLADPPLLGAPASPSAPAFLSVSPPARLVLAWLLAALGAELSPAWLSVPSSWQTCYSSSRVDLLILRDCTASALITGSLTPSVIGDRPSHPISKPDFAAQT